MYLEKRAVCIKQDKPIYCWKVGKDNKITKHVITEYVKDRCNGKDRYIFYFGFGKEASVRQHIWENKLNRYIYHSYYSFDNDDKVAIDTILASYRWEASDLAAKLDKINLTIQTIQKENNYEKK